MKIYGGLFLENLVARDQYYDLQCALFREGLIQGLQLRVAHPSYTPTITAENLRQVLSHLPPEMGFIVHYGAENTGVDFGRRFDEAGVYAKHASLEMTWRRWNRESIDWGITVAKHLPIDPKHPLGVAHPGYGCNRDDAEAQQEIRFFLKCYPTRTIALENVPALAPDNTGCSKFWGFGGTPADMALVIGGCGDPLCRCLIDFTHLVVTVNQGQAGFDLPQNLTQTIEDYMSLPRWPICHFSGIPTGLVDKHDFIHVQPPTCLRAAIRTMDTVCLEIPWRPETAREQIRVFRKLYGD